MKFAAVLFLSLISQSFAQDRELDLYRKESRLFTVSAEHLEHEIQNILELMAQSGIHEAMTELQAVLASLRFTGELEHDVPLLQKAREEFRTIIVVKAIGESLIRKHLLTKEVLSAALDLPNEIKSKIPISTEEPWFISEILGTCVAASFGTYMIFEASGGLMSPLFATILAVPGGAFMYLLSYNSFMRKMKQGISIPTNAASFRRFVCTAIVASLAPAMTSGIILLVRSHYGH
jgi:hypothetical protein